jgi:hypothetical protein
MLPFSHGCLPPYAENKCGPGQPPEPHSFGDVPLPSFISRIVDSATFPEMTRIGCEASQQHSHDPGGGPSEEVLTPEFPNTPKRARKLAAVHPQELPNATAHFAIGLFKTSHTCTVGTVLELGTMRNRKCALDCGETVQDQNCLWKAGEKAEVTTGGRAAIFGRLSQHHFPDLSPLPSVTSALVARTLSCVANRSRLQIARAVRIELSPLRDQATVK